MKPPMTLLASAALATVAVTSIVACARNAAASASPTTAAPLTTEARIERGRYLVHHVGLCVDCHSPRNERGEFIEEKQLTGTPLAFAPTVPMPWSGTAPGLAGLPAGYTETALVHFLMTGERPGGLPPTLPPMPAYRLERADAEAVAAYLRSLPAPEV